MENISCLQSPTSACPLVTWFHYRLRDNTVICNPVTRPKLMSWLEGTSNRRVSLWALEGNTAVMRRHTWSCDSVRQKDLVFGLQDAEQLPCMQILVLLSQISLHQGTRYPANASYAQEITETPPATRVTGSCRSPACSRI
jgi:hypothetical protein